LKASGLGGASTPGRRNGGVATPGMRNGRHRTPSRRNGGDATLNGRRRHPGQEEQAASHLRAGGTGTWASPFGPEG
ncbi:MAG TPA: hypothetical protein VHI52_12145, partial [Verrucomicrobiae bacterium]|nr:hypothetical protein [Verrucomicrobiae bacterium]